MQGHDQALTVLYVPYSMDSGTLGFLGPHRSKNSSFQKVGSKNKAGAASKPDEIKSTQLFVLGCGARRWSSLSLPRRPSRSGG